MRVMVYRSEGTCVIVWVGVSVYVLEWEGVSTRDGLLVWVTDRVGLKLGVSVELSLAEPEMEPEREGEGERSAVPVRVPVSVGLIGTVTDSDAVPLALWVGVFVEVPRAVITRVTEWVGVRLRERL